MTLKELVAKLESLAMYKNELNSAYKQELTGGSIGIVQSSVERQLRYIEEMKVNIKQLEDVEIE